MLLPGSTFFGVFFSRCGVIFAGSGAPGTPRGGYFLARRRDTAKITGGAARFTTSRMAKLDWIRATRGNRESSVR
jgi:hypothetical protein